jgi:hypothetical protein
MAYLKEHHKVSEDYKGRLAKRLAPCIKRAGLH